MDSPIPKPSWTKRFIKQWWLPALVVSTVVVAGLSLRGDFGRSTPPATGQPERRALFYQDSMHPWMKSDRPGKCTICNMELTPVYEDSMQLQKAQVDNLVSLNPNAITVLNVQTEEIKRQPLTHNLRVAGTLELNETKKRTIAAPASGRIDDLMVDYAGVEVVEGQTLVTFYSPALAQNTLKFLVRTRHTGPARDPAGNLAKELDANPYYADLLSPQNGTVLERNVTKGQYVAEGEKLFTIADASMLWFRFDVYEQQLPWVHRGQKIRVTVPAVPGEVYTAVISFVEPMLDEKTRTVKVRADVPNPLVASDGQKERRLRFGMYADGVLMAETPEVVTVPGSAILYPGQAAFAYVQRGSGTFERRQVKLGREGNGSWEVLEGLNAGDRVVISGNVLLDAQANFVQPTLDSEMDSTKLRALENDHDMNGMLLSSAPNRMSVRPEMSTEMPGHMAMDTDTNLASPNPAPQPLTHPVQGMQMQRAARLPKPGLTQAGERGTNSPAMAGRRSNSLMNHASARRQAALPGSPQNKPNVHMLDVQIMDRWRDRFMAEEMENARSVTNASLSVIQCQSLKAFLEVADNLTQALASDDLAQFNRQVSTLAKVVPALEAKFLRGDEWKGRIVHLGQASQWPAATNLAEARAQFLPFTINVADLAANLRSQIPDFAGLKIYHCPMAPKPGLWVQAAGPLRNPFFGLKMLSCGEEMKSGAAGSTRASLPASKMDASPAGKASGEPLQALKTP